MFSTNASVNLSLWHTHTWRAAPEQSGVEREQSRGSQFWPQLLSLCDVWLWSGHLTFPKLSLLSHVTRAVTPNPEVGCAGEVNSRMSPSRLWAEERVCVARARWYPVCNWCISHTDPIREFHSGAEWFTKPAQKWSQLRSAFYVAKQQGILGSVTLKGRPNTPLETGLLRGFKGRGDKSLSLWCFHSSLIVLFHPPRAFM